MTDELKKMKKLTKKATDLELTRFFYHFDLMNNSANKVLVELAKEKNDAELAGVGEAILGYRTAVFTMVKAEMLERGLRIDAREDA